MVKWFGRLKCRWFGHGPIENENMIAGIYPRCMACHKIVWDEDDWDFE